MAHARPAIRTGSGWLAPAAPTRPAPSGARLSAQAAVTATWTPLDTDGAPVREIGMGSAGLLWLGTGSVADPAARVLAYDQRDRRVVAEARDTLIEQDPRRVRSSGDIEGFWAIDGSSFIWVGPRYFDGRAWTWLDRSGALPGGRIDFQPRAWIGPRAAVWAPFRFQGDCSLPQDCQARGLKSYGPEGPRKALVEYAPLPEADRFGLADLHFFGTPSDEPLPDRHAWIAARGGIHRMPEGERFGYPLLEPTGEPGELRNAGYASTALVSPHGRLQAVLWVEEQVPEGARYRTLLATWDAEALAWMAVEDLAAEGGLAGADPKAERIVGAAWGPWDEGAPALWCVISDGRLGLYRDGRWLESWRPEDLGAAAGSRALSVFSSADSVVVGTDGAALRRATGPTVDPTPVATVFVPRVGLRR